MQGTNCSCNTAAAEAREASREKTHCRSWRGNAEGAALRNASLTLPLPKVTMHGSVLHAGFSVGGLRQFLGQFIAVTPRQALEGFLVESPRSAMVFLLHLRLSRFPRANVGTAEAKRLVVSAVPGEAQGGRRKPCHGKGARSECASRSAPSRLWRHAVLCPRVVSRFSSLVPCPRSPS
jgi:hypothetical protein